MRLQEQSHFFCFLPLHSTPYTLHQKICTCAFFSVPLHHESNLTQFANPASCHS